jgi:hypothetical protein
VEEAVVRVRIADRRALGALTAWAEPWEVHPEAGYAILQVDRRGWERLEAEGFDPREEAALTAVLRRRNAPLPGQTAGISGFPCYRTVEEIHRDAAALAETRPDLVALLDIGDSWERTVGGAGGGYDLLALRLGSSAPGTRAVLAIVAGLHAREYVTAELALRFAEQLVGGYGNDPVATDLLDRLEILVILLANPDGRKRAETGLLWRKNVQDDGGCLQPRWVGTDLNRNWARGWGCCDGSSPDPCSDVFRGRAPASAPETAALEAFLAAAFAASGGESGLLLDLHSYGGLILWPWGSTADPSPHHLPFRTLGRRLAFFNNALPQQSFQLYPVDGTLIDQNYAARGVASLLLEIGSTFFEPCERFEEQILHPTMSLLAYAASVAPSPYHLPSGPVVTAASVTREGIGSLVVQARVDDTPFASRGGSEEVHDVDRVVLSREYPPPAGEAADAIALEPADGRFDSPAEDAVAAIPLRGLAQGRHTFYLRGRDASGAWGTPRPVWVEITAPRLLFFPLVGSGAVTPPGDRREGQIPPGSVQ